MAVAAAASNKSSGALSFAREIRGATAVAGTFRGRARTAQPALVDGGAGAVWAPGGVVRAVFGFVITDGKIVELEVTADPAHIAELDVRVLGQ